MSGINNIGSNLLQSYVNYQSKSEFSPKEMFQILSLDMGGDSETITKDQLDTYIESAEDGSIDLSDKELGALTTLQDNWNTISNGKDSITPGDMLEYTGLLATAVTGGISVSESFVAATETSSSTIDDIDSYLIESALSSSNGGSYKSNLTSLLNTLLTGTTDEEDDTNANLIGTLTNLIAENEKSSTVEFKA